MFQAPKEVRAVLDQQKYKAVVFDVFGVLAEDGWGLIDSTYKPSDVQWAEMSDTSHMADKGIITLQDLQKTFANTLGVPVAEISKVISSQKKNLQLLKVITDLRGQGYKIGMISNVARGFIQDYFSAQELALFDSVVLSGDVGIVKPDPRMYKISANQLGVLPEECIFTDDNQRNTAGAEAVGMTSILYASYDTFSVELESILR